MAEFGENLRKAREDKGMTQQTLADKIYVTRQAVSRWEGGSRYPDLMTAKKLSMILDISLDDLLRDDDMERLPQVNPVVEYPLTKRIQTAILACCLVPTLIYALWYTAAWIVDFFSTDEAGGAYLIIGSVNTILYHYLLAALFGYGTYLSIKDNLTPNITGILATLFFGENIVQRIISLLLNGPFVTSRLVAYDIVGCAIDIVALTVMLLYFSGHRLKSPKPVYAVSLLYSAIALLVFINHLAIGVTGRMAEESMGYYTGTLFRSIVQVFLTVSLLLLLSYMARELDIKRKVSTVKESQ